MKKFLAILTLIASGILQCQAQVSEISPSESLYDILQEVEQKFLSQQNGILEIDTLRNKAIKTYHQISLPSVDDLQAYSSILVSSALASQLKGDEEAMKSTSHEALRAIEAIGDIDPLSKASMLTDWTSVLQKLGEDEQARNLLNEVLELYAEKGEDCDGYANAMAAYGMLAYKDGFTELAETFAKRALEMNQRLYGEGVNIMGSGEYMLMSTIKARHKDYKSALHYVNMAIESVKMAGGALNNISFYYATVKLDLFDKLGMKDSIAAMATRTVGDLVAYMTQTLAGLNSYQRANFVNNTSGFLGSTIPYYATLTGDKRLMDLAYNSQLFIKGLLLNADAELSKIIEESGNAELKRKHADISRLSHEVAQLKPQNDADVVRLKQLNLQLQQQETSLLQTLRGMGIDPTANLTTDWRDVRDVLHKNEAAIEFVAFRPDNTSRTFGCLILKPDCEHPQYVQLYRSHDFASKEKEKEEEAYPYTIWTTLKPYLQSVKTVYFSPIAELHKLPIEHINTDGLGIKLIRVSSTRQLTANHQYAGSKAVAVGGIDYDCDANTTSELSDASTVVFRDAPLLDRGAVRKLVPLQGTKDEATLISMMINKGKAKGFLKDVTVITAFGNTPTEGYIKHLSGANMRFLHIGTHGFYSSNSNKKNKEEKENELTAMRRCGLFMAGANKSLGIHAAGSLKEDDGILTASEIASLDFSGMELVSLSACQSGLGDISHEGVFGLQRAFKKAGAGAILMSLWKVDDEATTKLMVNFYNNLTEGKTKYEALEKAKAYLRSIPKYSDSKFWAAFVLLDAFD